MRVPPHARTGNAALPTSPIAMTVRGRARSTPQMARARSLWPPGEQTRTGAPGPAAINRERCA